MSHIEDILLHSWSTSTITLYGSGLLAFHTFCDKNHIPEEQRAPASQDLIAAFISNLVGAYTASTILNYVSGIRAWHLLHRVKWAVDQTELDLLLRSADRLAPARPTALRLPYTPQMIAALADSFDLTQPLDAVVFACLTTAFYSCAWLGDRPDLSLLSSSNFPLGEFTVPSLNSFDPLTHVKLSDVRVEYDRDGNRVTTFFIPSTKAAVHGETVLWAAQTGPTDPQHALARHFRVNCPPGNRHLFAYKHTNTYQPLTKSIFICRVQAAAKASSVSVLPGHSIHIGATLEYLLRRVPFEVVKSIGRWSSNAFTTYLRKHGQILARYLQPNRDALQTLIHITMPPVR